MKKVNFINIYSGELERLMESRFSKDIIDNVPQQNKFDYSGWLNCSSNELKSKSIQLLFQNYLAQQSDYEVYKYPYFQTATGHLAELFRVSPGQLLLTGGTNVAIFILLHCFGRTVEQMIIEQPNYEQYVSYAHLNGVNLLTVDYDGDENAVNYLSIIKKNTNCIIQVTNPHGWSGLNINKKAMEEIAFICKKNSHILIIDEAYGVFDDVYHTDLLSVYNNIFLIRSLSKALGIASLRVGCVLSTEPNISYVNRWNPSSPISQFSLDFLDYCIQNYEYIQNVQNRVVENRETLKKTLKGMYKGWRIWDTHSNFITIQFSSKRDFLDFVDIMTRNKIKIRDLSSSPTYSNCIRMTIHEEIDDIIMTVFKQYLKGR